MKGSAAVEPSLAYLSQFVIERIVLIVIFFAN